MTESVNITKKVLTGELLGSDINNSKRAITIEWDCGAGAATITNTDLPDDVMEYIKGWYCFFAVTIPGNHAKYAGSGVAPSALYNIELLDEYSVPVFGGTLHGRSATESEQQVPKVGDGLSSRLVAGTWTLKVDNNTTNNASGKVVLYFEL